MVARQLIKVFRASMFGLLIFLYSLAIGSVSNILADTQATQYQNFGAIRRTTHAGVPKVTGAHAYLTTPNAPVNPNNSDWTAAILGTTWWTSPYFAEVGAIKKCSLSACEYHPYMAWRGSGDSNSLLDIHSEINLAANGWYEYRIFHDSGTLWTAHFCSGTGCVALTPSKDLHSSINMYYADSGTESVNGQMGPVQTSVNQWSNINRTWQDYCYELQLKNVNAGISQCGTTNHDWTLLKYP